MSNVATRILVGLIGIPLMIWIVLLGGWYFTALFTIIAALALKELYHLFATKGFRPNAIVGIAGAIAWMIFCGLYRGMNGEVFVMILSITALCTLSIELIRSYHKETSVPAHAVSATLGGFVYVPILLSSLILLRNTAENSLVNLQKYFSQAQIDPGAALVLLVFIGVWSGDTFAYFGGMAIGKTPLMPHVSPKKTIEGAVIGFVSSIVLMLIFTVYMFPNFPLHYMFIGDLVESLMKRDAHVKDSSALIPGHGGIFDRFDSMIFAGPIFYCFLLLLNALL